MTVLAQGASGGCGQIRLESASGCVAERRRGSRVASARPVPRRRQAALAPANPWQMATCACPARRPHRDTRSATRATRRDAAAVRRSCAHLISHVRLLLSHVRRLLSAQPVPGPTRPTARPLPRPTRRQRVPPPPTAAAANVCAPSAVAIRVPSTRRRAGPVAGRLKSRRDSAHLDSHGPSPRLRLGGPSHGCPAAPGSS